MLTNTYNVTSEGQIMVLNVAVVVKLEPDFSEGSISYNPDGTLNRNETKSTLGPHSKIAAQAAFYAKVKYSAKISIASMSGHVANTALQQAMQTCDAEVLHLYNDVLFAGADTLGTAETLKAGIDKMDGKMDIVFSGHRASDGETGQTGPQIAWKLGFPFFGHVISYDVNLEKKTIVVRRLLSLQGMPDVVEEVEAPLPVFIAIDPSYKYEFNTVSERLISEKYQREAYERAKNYKDCLQVFNSEKLGVDRALVGLAGSPTIVYDVQRVPKSKATRHAEVLDGSNPEHIRKVVSKMREALSAMVTK